MSGQKIYCEVEFLQNFINNKPDFTFSAASIEKVDRWIHTYKMLINSKVVFDNIDDFLAEAKENEVFTLLWKNSIQHADKLDFLNAAYPDLNKLEEKVPEHNFLSSLFLTGKEDKEGCDTIMGKYGVLVFNNETLFENDDFFTKYTEVINPDKEDVIDLWDFMGSPRFPSNSLCLADRFIFKNLENIEYNLVPILDALLPEQLGVEYHITVFTLKPEEGDTWTPSTLSKELVNRIKQIRPSIETKVSIVYITYPEQKKYHDRVLTTNNVFVYSGSGFDGVYEHSYTGKLQIKHDTKITISHPLSFPEKSKKDPELLYEHWISKMRNTFASYKEVLERSNSRYRPSNRLIEKH